MANLRLDNNQRQALRAACRAHRDCADVLRDHFSDLNVSALTKEQLFELAARLGISVVATIASAAPAQPFIGIGPNGEPRLTHPAQPSATYETAPTGWEALQDAADDAAECEPVQELLPVDADPDASVRAMVDSALAPLGALRGLVAPSIMGAVEANVLAMAREASKPPVEVVRTVKVDEHGAAIAQPVATVRGTEIAAKVFGFNRHSPLAKLNVDLWNAPDAPARDPLFRFEPEALTDLVTAVKRGRHVWLWGPKGTGKTSLAMQFAAFTGRPFCRVAIDRTTEAADLIGGPGLRGGATVWRNGVLTEAMERPGTVILIDEPTYGRPGALAVLQTVLDFGFVTLKEDGGRRVDAAPGVIFLASDNTNGTGDETGQYADTGTMNAAFLDRFSKFVQVGYLAADVEAEVIAGRTGCTRVLANVLQTFASVSRKRAEGGDLTGGVGLRRLLALAEALSDGIDPERAVATTVTGCAPPEDRAVLAELIAAHLNPQELARVADPNAKPVQPVQPAATPEGQRAQRDFA